MTVRTRVAPSPTGDPHVGTAYIALFNLAFAKSHNGQFILRIEDTDQVRSTPESEKAILDSLQWLGLNWDEGPDVGGDKGPYRQSERSELYKQYCQELVDKGHAFYCFCTPQRLDALRKEQMAEKKTTGYDGHCLSLSKEEVDAKIAAGEPYVIRMKVPREGTCVVNDMLRGDIEIDWERVDMQILMKADGLPTYHLANVVDDHLMEITHVIRGEEWINSAPKHQLLYEYFGWDMPVLCHLPLLRNPDKNKSKLSKRKNPTSINFYKKFGYLPETVVNFLGMMGWSMPDEREIFTVDEMISEFDIKRVSLGGPVFDLEKLDHLNGRWLREKLDDDAFISRFSQWAFNPETVQQMIPLIKGRVERFSDVAPLAGFFLAGHLNISAEDFNGCKMEQDAIRKALQFSLWKLEALRTWEKDDIFATLKPMAEVFDVKIKDFLAPFFIAISGSAASVSVMDSMAILGADMTRARLRHAVQVLGGMSKKEAKNWEKEFAALTV